MNDKVILALDLGTSSVRAILFDEQGRIRKRTGSKDPADAQIKYEQRTTADGGVEVDADQLVEITVKCIAEVLAHTGNTKPRICGVGISCFWHSLVGVGADGQVVTPLYSWADTRSAKYAVGLKTRIDAVAYHRRTGCELHPSFWPAKLAWLSADRSDLFRSVHQWMGFGEYLMLRLLGTSRMSISMASGTGLFNQSTCEWDAETIDALGLERSTLPEIEPVSGSNNAATTGEGLPAKIRQLAGTPWRLPIGDGACSNIGSGAIDQARIALNIGTSAAMRVVASKGCGGAIDIVDGLFSYRVDRQHALIGGAFANGGNVHWWLSQALRYDDSPEFQRSVSKVNPDGHGLTVLPFWSGERSPGWHADARAVISGMNLHTTSAEIVRASLEACAYSFDVVRERIQQRFPEAKTIVASGGALVKDALWAQILADVFATPIEVCEIAEASSRGAAILAAVDLGYLERWDSASAIHGKVYQPDRARQEIYAAGRVRFGQLYGRLIGSNEQANTRPIP